MKLWGGIVLLITTPFFSAHGADLNWSTAVQMTQQNNPELKQTHSSVDAAKAQTTVARSGFLPTVTAAATGALNGDIGDNQTQVGGAGGRGDPTKDYKLSLTVKQSLFNGNRDQNDLKRSESLVEAAQSDVDAIRNDLYRDLRQAFDQALYYQELVQLNRRAMERRRQNVRIVKLRYGGGHEHKGSLMKSEAAANQAETELIQAQRNLQVALTKMSQIIGSPVAPDSRLIGQLREPVSQKEPDYKAMVEKAPTRRKIEAQLRAAESRVAIERSSMRPDLSAHGSITRDGGIDAPNTDRYAVGLTLTVPLYDGSRTTGSVRAAVAEMAQTQYARENTDWLLLVTYQNAFATLADARERVGVQTRFVAASQTQAEITRSRYTLGLVTFQEWDSIENELITNEKALLSSRKDAALALAGWEHAQGVKLEDSIR